MADLDEDGRIALHRAVRGSTPLHELRALVEAGCDLSVPDRFCRTSLQSALELQDSVVCEYLVGEMATQGRRLPVTLPAGVTAWTRGHLWASTLDSLGPVSGEQSTGLSQDGYLALVDLLVGLLRLPETIVERILDDAEFWVTTAVVRDDSVSVTENSSVEPYITIDSPALQGYLRRVDIAIVSHDQGWCDQGIPESYSGSFTWFDVAVVKDTNDEVFLHLQDNVCASSSPRMHYNEIRPREPLTAAWLHAIQPGDKIGVIPRALYSGWRNHVKSVKIMLWYAMWHV